MPGQATGTERDVDSEPRSFASILRAQQSMVFSIAYHFLRDRSAAEEVAQDVFLQLHKRFDEFKSDAHVAFWLRKVASNRSIDYVRRRKPTVNLETAPPASVDGSPEDHFLHRRRQSANWAMPERPGLVGCPPHQ